MKEEGVVLLWRSTLIKKEKKPLLLFLFLRNDQRSSCR